MNPKHLNVTGLVHKLLVAKQKLVDEGYDYDRKTRIYTINSAVLREVIVELQEVVKSWEFGLCLITSFTW